MAPYSRRFDPEDPASYVDPETPRRLMRAALFQKRMAPWEQLRDRAIIAVLYLAGLRAFEVGHLDVASVYLTERRLRLRVQKGGRAPVMLYMGNRLTAILADYLPKREERWGPAGALFPTRFDTRISRHSVWALVKRLAVASGVDPGQVWPHKLRHALATHLFEAGVEAPVVQQAMRHASLATTTIYSQANPQRRAAAAQALDWDD